jgi:hypothetical protein
MRKYVEVPKDYDKRMDQIEQMVRVVSVRIRTNPPILNFKVESTRVLIRAYGSFVTISENLGNDSAYEAFPKLVMKRMEPIIKKYSYDGSPKYFSLFEQKNVHIVRETIYKFYRSLDRDTVLSMKNDIEKKKTIVRNMAQSLVDQKLTKE